MLDAILQGIGLGLLMCVLVGPVFFALMSVALHYSKRAAIRFATGTAISDLIYAIIVFMTVGAFSLSEAAKWRMGIAGSIVFAIMGIIMIHKTRKHQLTTESAQLELHRHPHWFTFFGQGFITNALNPSVILFRAGAVSASAATLERSSLIPLLIITTLVVFYITDLLKVQAAGKLKQMLRGKVLYRLHMITGLLLIALGIFVLIRTVLTHHI